MLGKFSYFIMKMYVVCTHENCLIEAILMSTLNFTSLNKWTNRKKKSLNYRHLLPDLAPWLTESGSNYPYLKEIFKVPKMFEPLRFDCMWLIWLIMKCTFHSPLFSQPILFFFIRLFHGHIFDSTACMFSFFFFFFFFFFFIYFFNADNENSLHILCLMILE